GGEVGKAMALVGSQFRVRAKTDGVEDDPTRRVVGLAAENDRGRVAMCVDEARKNCMAAPTDGSLSVPPTCWLRRPSMHDTAASHCDFSIPHNGYSVRHR